LAGEPEAARPPGPADSQAGPELGVGLSIGRYKLLEKIGEGGCGVVYVAEQTEPVRRRVALKVIKLGMDTKAVVARFEAERQALAMMDHANIARVFDGGTTETGRPYFVMELVRGIAITRYCDEASLTTRERLELFIKVCQAVQHAHQKGIIHRDLKPSNILVTLHDGVPVPKVIDFGIAKAIEGRLTEHTVYTQLHQFMGTPAYMSPEQAELTGLDIDTRSDIYSLGVLLYELLAGSPPFDPKELLASGLDAMRKIIREQEPVRPSTRLGTLIESDSTTTAKRRSTDPVKLRHQLQGDLDWIVMKCLEKDRQRRYETANGLAFDIRRHLHDEPVLARPPSAAYRFQKAFRRQKVVFTAAIVTAAALLLGLGATSVLLVREQAARRGLNGTLADLEMDKSEALFAAGDASAALAYLAHASRRNAAPEVAASKMFWALTRRPYWIRLTEPMRHSDEVTSARFSGDGRQVVTASKDGTARVWDAQTGQPLAPPLRHADAVISARFSPDGRWVVTGSSDGTARVWEAKTGQPLAPPLHHQGRVSSAQFSPDGERVVTASLDGTARVWEARTGQPVTAPLPHKEAVLEAEFSPDSRRVLTASEDRTAQIWDVATSRPTLPPLEALAKVVCARFSPDGRRVATVTSDRWVNIWDANTGKSLSSFFGVRDSPRSLEFSPDGQRLLAAGGFRAVVHDLVAGHLLGGWMVHSSEIQSAQFSPDGQRVVTACADRTARVWDARTGLPSAQETLEGANAQLNVPLGQPFRHAGPVNFAQFSPDGLRVVTASADHTAQVWVAPTCASLTVPFKHAEWIRNAEFSPDGRRVLTSSQDRTARVWDARIGQPLTPAMQHPLSRPNGLSGATFSPDARRVLTASYDGTAQVWDAQTGQRLNGPLQHAGPVISFDYSNDGRRVVTASTDKTARVWDPETGHPLTPPLQHGDIVSAAGFSPDGLRVVTASNDKTARVWDAQTGQAVTAPLQHHAEVWYAVFSPDSQRVATASNDGTARVWDAQTGRAMTGPLEHQASISCVRFSPDGRRVVTASEDKTARVWDARTGQAQAGPLQHHQGVLYAEFSPDGSRVLTASADGTMRLWDAETGRPLSEPLPQGALCSYARFSPDGLRVAAVASTVARIWETPRVPAPPEWVLSLAEAMGGQRLDERGMARPVPPAQLLALKRQVTESTAGDFWTRCAKWIFANPATRTLSPTSPATVPEYVERRIQESTPESLREALSLSPDNGLAMALLGFQVFQQDPSQYPRHVGEAAWYSLRAAQLAPREPVAWLLRSLVQGSTGQATEALASADRVLELDPQTVEAWELKGDLAMKGRRWDEAVVCWTRVESLLAGDHTEARYLELKDPQLRRFSLFNRAKVFRELGRPPEAARDILMACGIPERSPQAGAGLIDLSLYYNEGLRGSWVYMYPGNGLDSLPTGVQTFAGISFDVRGLVQARFPGMAPDDTVLAVIPAIAVGAKAQRLHFLHGAISVARGKELPGTTVAKYVIHYTDGETRERPIQLENDVMEWWAEPAGPAAQHVAWSGENATSRANGKQIHLYLTTWDNPRPDAEILNLDLVSEGKSVGVFLVAVTRE